MMSTFIYICTRVVVGLLLVGGFMAPFALSAFIFGPVGLLGSISVFGLLVFAAVFGALAFGDCE